MDRTTALLGTILSLAAAALFSGAMIQLVVDQRLQFYLNDQKFETLVLAGGVILSILIFLRILALASQGMTPQHSHDSHDHGDHGHDHSHEGDDHNHEHAPSLWRLILLALPLMLIFMGVPKGFSMEGLERKLSAAELKSLGEIGGASGKAKNSEPKIADLRVLANAAGNPALREEWDRTLVDVVGQYGSAGLKDRFRLMRVKITCCAADAVPLNVNVLNDQGNADPSSWENGQWIEVRGVVNFVDVKSRAGGRVETFPVINLVSARKTDPQPWLK